MNGSELFVYFINSANSQQFKGPKEFKAIVDQTNFSQIGTISLVHSNDHKHSLLLVVDRHPLDCDSILDTVDLLAFIKNISTNYKHTTIQLPRLSCRFYENNQLQLQLFNLGFSIV